jgi:hypothetical protein
VPGNDVCATGIGQIKLGPGQVQIADLWMTQVGNPFGVSHIGLFPELRESFIATG